MCVVAFDDAVVVDVGSVVVIVVVWCGCCGWSC